MEGFSEPREGRQKHDRTHLVFLPPLPWLTYRTSRREPTAHAVGHILSPLMRLRRQIVKYRSHANRLCAGVPTRD